MTDQTVTVTLTENEARRLVDRLPDGNESAICGIVKERIKAALPPEWEEGTIAWVHLDHRADSPRYLCERVAGAWCHGMRRVSEASVTKVVPLRVLGDDELAVGRVAHLTAEEVRGLRNGLLNCKGSPHLVSRDVLDAYADALAAEERAR